MRRDDEECKVCVAPPQLTTARQHSTITRGDVYYSGDVIRVIVLNIFREKLVLFDEFVCFFDTDTNVNNATMADIKQISGRNRC